MLDMLLWWSLDKIKVFTITYNHTIVVKKDINLDYNSETHAQNDIKVVDMWDYKV